jgi:hypothetical protein
VRGGVVAAALVAGEVVGLDRLGEQLGVVIARN